MRRLISEIEIDVLPPIFFPSSFTPGRLIGSGFGGCCPGFDPAAARCQLATLNRSAIAASSCSGSPQNESAPSFESNVAECDGSWRISTPNRRHVSVSVPRSRMSTE